MKRLSILVASAVAALSLFAIGATAAMADGTVDGNIHDSTGTVNCDFVDAAYTGSLTGTSGDQVTISGTSLKASLVTSTTCDPTSINSITDITTTFHHSASPVNWSAVLDPFTVVATVKPLGFPIQCSFTTDTITSDSPGPANEDGSPSGYDGSGSTTGSGGFGCSLASPSLTLEGAVFTES